MSAPSAPWRPRFGPRSERRVLVLRGSLAIWTLWRDGRRVDLRREPLDDPHRDRPRCPWPAPGETLVDVVVDSPLDEIDRVHAPTLVGGPLGPWRRGLLRLRLARAHPDAAVRMAPPALAPLAASLLRADLPERWTNWLAALQRDAVTVRVLHSAIRLRRAPRVGPHGHGALDGDVLEITRGAGTLRHTLWRSGCPTFTRMIAADEAGSERAALEETLAHLAERHGVGPESVRVVGEGAADAADEAERLAALAFAAARGRRAGPETPVLLAKQRWRRELLRLRAITVLTVAVASWTVLVGSIHGITSARERARSLDAAETLAARVERLDGAVASLHPDPKGAAALLAHLEGHRDRGAVEAVAALRFVASVLSAHPTVHLDRLEWTFGNGALATASVSEALPRPSAPDISRDLSIELAGRIGGTGGTDAVGAGPADRADRVDGAAGHAVRAGGRRSGVGERQRVFDALVDDLRARAGVTALAVRLSPALAAARGGAAREDYALGFRYRAVERR